MPTFTRRSLAALVLAAAARPALAQDAPKELRIGFQKTGLPVIARRLGLIEKALAAQGTGVRWVEFTAGPPLLEAMNVGSVDIGWTGDTPPIFAQSAGASLVYVAALPSNGAGEAIVVKADSPVRSLADLKGRKIGVTKGSSAHNLTVAALERAGVAYAKTTPVFLSPADAAAAFARDSIDAWAIWDPFFAIAEVRHHPRVLVTSKDALSVNTYLLANKGFAAGQGATIVKALGALDEAAAWAGSHRDDVARTLHEATGVDLAAMTLAAGRLDFGIGPLTDAVIVNQQATADRFSRLGLLPRAVAVRDAVWTRPQA